MSPMCCLNAGTCGAVRAGHRLEGKTKVGVQKVRPGACAKKK